METKWVTNPETGYRYRMLIDGSGYVAIEVTDGKRSKLFARGDKLFGQVFKTYRRLEPVVCPTCHSNDKAKRRILDYGASAAPCIHEWHRQ